MLLDRLLRALIEDATVNLTVATDGRMRHEAQGSA